jgi:hypothetical protein
MADDEFGPWIEHDGKGCPVPDGTVVRVVDFCNARGVRPPSVGVARNGPSWDWRNHPGFTMVLRYQIKKPRGLTILEGLLENLPSPIDTTPREKVPGHG